MSKEELRLVTDFGELRAGMLVVVRPCRCGRTHGRTMLLNKGLGRVEGIDGTERFDYLPQFGCHRPGQSRRAVSRCTVDEGRLFRVIDGLESSIHETTQRTKEAAR